jgi:hypothetical protein
VLTSPGVSDSIFEKKLTGTKQLGVSVHESVTFSCSRI